MRFNYTARDKAGRIYKSNLEAKDEASARARLRQQGFYVTSVSPIKGLKVARGRVKAQDLVIFTERLMVMVNAGLPVIRSLQTIAKQTENELLGKVLANVVHRVAGGSTFSGALAQHPQVFSRLYVSLVGAGEAGGIMEDVLNKISQYLSKEQALKDNLKKAFSYPAIVAGVAACVVAFLVIFVVPTFAETYRKMGLSLPLPTLVLIGISKFTAGFWWIILMAAGLAAFSWKALKRSMRGQLFLDNFKLGLPIFGDLNRKVIVSRFVSTFGLLISSGVSVMEALVLMRTITTSRIIVTSIDRLRARIGAGRRIGDSLAGEKLFPPIVVQMVSAGEESGRMGLMLEKSAHFLERDIDSTTEKLVLRLEPILTFALALVVGFIALAIYLPMFDVLSKVTK